MKAIAILPAAAMLALSVSTASSQQACVNEYQACMTACGSKPSQSMQEACFARCQTTNETCAERVFGKRPSGGDAANAQASAPVQANEAVAQKQQAEPVEQKPVEPEQAPEQAVAPQRKPARR
jgi:hypothetical protein